MPPTGFEPKTSADERPQTYVLDRATIGICKLLVVQLQILVYVYCNIHLLWASSHPLKYINKAKHSNDT